MKTLSLVSDKDLLALMPELVLAERAHTADVIEHLVEIHRRRLFLDAACSSLTAYCIERLGYSEDEAGKRVRAARLARRFPELLEELRSGAIHLSGLAVLAPVLTRESYAELVEQARGKTRRQIEELVARRFPKPDVPERICPLPEQTSAPALAHPGSGNRPGTGPAAPAARVEPLSASRWSVQLTIDSELRDKIERARDLLSHALPSGDLAALFGRALDALIERETKRRLGAGKPRRRRPLRPGSRHVPVEVARLVWERDEGRCTFVDESGQRCSATRFVTIEHCDPYALGGPPIPENLCLLCAAHNRHAARKVFGDAHVDAKIADKAYAQVREGLRRLGFRDKAVDRALGELRKTSNETNVELLLRAALELLVPAAPGAAKGPVRVSDSRRPAYRFGGRSSSNREAKPRLRRVGVTTPGRISLRLASIRPGTDRCAK